MLLVRAAWVTMDIPIFAVVQHFCPHGGKLVFHFTTATLTNWWLGSVQSIAISIVALLKIPWRGSKPRETHFTE